MRLFGRLVFALAILLTAGFAFAARGSSAHEEAAHPAHIHTGSCDKPGDVVAPLSDVSVSENIDGTPAAGASAMGQANPNEVNASVTTVKMPISAVADGNHLIMVHESMDKIGSYIACGEIGGTMIGTDLPISLRALNDSEESGVAVLHENSDGTTTVSLYLSRAAQVAQAAPAPSGSDVAITLSDMKIDLSQTTFKAGVTYTFTATNDGAAVHEAVIEHSGDVDKPLPNGGKDAEIENVDPGSTKSMTFTFPAPGKYQIACHQPGHFEAGMVIQVDVTN